MLKKAAQARYVMLGVRSEHSQRLTLAAQQIEGGADRPWGRIPQFLPHPHVDTATGHLWLLQPIRTFSQLQVLSGNPSKHASIVNQIDVITHIGRQVLHSCILRNI